ncbi:hypothetical protein GCM10009836_53930 [Pseudonocardia ailaonensis]|uniref:Dienelactone hydrolase domain-containing protein n=1 Tax=Pseudonocardia ailaonensis TaxID=367279 RepID=A0ABN2NHB4_9PSEU
MTGWPPAGWEQHEVPHGGHRHAYYVLGDSDAPGVLLLHEFPGVNAALVRFAGELAERFRVTVPSIVGRDGRPSTPGTVARLCVRREVHFFRTGRTSPAVPWLRTLFDEVVARGEDRPCGVVGMCMTGGFALALAVDPRVRAAVVAQPAAPAAAVGRLPFADRRHWAADLGLGEDDRAALCARTDLRVRGYRYDGDPLSPPERLQAAEDLLGADRLHVTTFDPPVPKAHSTLTGEERHPGAVAEVVAFLTERLG